MSYTVLELSNICYKRTMVKIVIFSTTEYGVYASKQWKHWWEASRQGLHYLPAFHYGLLGLQVMS